MATIDLLRRRIAMAQAKADEYEGVMLGQGIGIGANKYVFNECILATTPPITFPQGCAHIYWKAMAPWNVTGGRMMFFNSEDTLISILNCTGYNRLDTGNLSEGVKTRTSYIRMTFDVEYIDDCFIFDVTNNVYLWKGKNV